MHRVIANLLLSLALIFQGLGAECANGASLAGMTGKAATAGQAMAMNATDQASDACQGCPGCPDTRKSGDDCMHSCSLPAGLPGLASFSRQIAPSEGLLPSPRPSLVEFAQAPPTPPPIA